MIVYAFDVDHTVEISEGPVTLKMMMDLRVAGHIVGLNGNAQRFLERVDGWQHLVSFFNVGLPKPSYLGWLRQAIKADDYVMVGNILGVTGGSDDEGAARDAGWRFILERDFAAGAR